MFAVCTSRRPWGGLKSSDHEEAHCEISVDWRENTMTLHCCDLQRCCERHLLFAVSPLLNDSLNAAVTHFFAFRSCFKTLRFWELLKFIGAYSAPLVAICMKMCQKAEKQKHSGILCLLFVSHHKFLISSNHLISSREAFNRLLEIKEQR